MKNVSEGNRTLEEAFSRRSRSVRAGVTIFERGQRAREIFVVNYGLVTIDNTQSQRNISPGRIFGEEAHYRRVYKTSAVTVQDSEIGSVSRTQMQILLNECPELAFTLVGFLAGDRVEENEAAPLIKIPTRTELDILQLAASGLTRRSIGRKLLTAESNVNYYARKLFRNLEVTTMPQAVFTGYELGLIDVAEAIQNLNPWLIKTLGSRKLEILSIFTSNGGEVSSPIQLGQHLGVTKNTIEKHFLEISDVLNTRSHTQSGLLYLVAREAGMLDEVK